MKWVGLTGGIGTGKTTVAMMFRELGVPVIDADEISRSVLAPGGVGVGETVKLFGEAICGADGVTIDRKKLGEFVFSDPIKRQQLEGIVHPHVRDRVARDRLQLESQNELVAIYDVPLLFEAGLSGQFDDIIVVFCKEEVQRLRLSKRDRLSDLEIEKRLASQWPLIEKISLATFPIDNSESKKILKGRVAEVWRKLMKK